MAVSVAKHASRAVALAFGDQPRAEWWGAHADFQQMATFGIRLGRSGTHQSKTMMLKEISTLWAFCEASPAHSGSLIVESNILNKRTASTRALSFRHLDVLYGIETMPPIPRVFAALWRLDRKGWPLLALLCALARDPLLRDTATTVLDAPVGTSVRWPVLGALFEELYPDRFSPTMLKSLAQNCASTWTQSGHLRGAVKKQRVRVEPTAHVAAFAALIANVCGFGGPALLDSTWMAVLDLSRDRALDLLRQAQAHGVVRVRSAGDVLEVSVRQPMAVATGVTELAHLR
jgi:hypothetical protein